MINLDLTHTLTTLFFLHCFWILRSYVLFAFSVESSSLLWKKPLHRICKTILSRQIHSMTKQINGENGLCHYTFLYCYCFVKPTSYLSNWYRAILCLCFINECLHNLLVFRVSVTLPKWETSIIYDNNKVYLRLNPGNVSDSSTWVL